MASKNDLSESVSMTYHLADLPSAQHKAGLSGMLLLIRNLDERRQFGQEIGELPAIEQINAGQVTLSITAAGLQTLFDDLYAAEFVETKKGKEFPRPSGNYLRHWLDEGHEIWTKQLADALTSVIYSKPTTWNPFKERAGGRPVPKAGDLYRQLAQAGDDEKANQKVKGQHFTGAGEENAERVGFATTPRLFLLLHFWILVSPLFAPRILKEERDTVTGERYLDAKIDPSAYLLAIPEPSDLAAFLDGMRDYWRQLSPAKAGFRPAEAIIDMPAEAGLEFLLLLGHDKANATVSILPVVAVELYALVKKGNNVNLASADRVQPNPEMLEEYRLHVKDGQAHPLFKRLAIGNLMAGQPWWNAAQSVLAHYDANNFFGRNAKMRFRPFGYDARRRFEIL